MPDSYKISEIAQALGLSKTTVSRAISGKGRVSEQTKEKVFEYIDSLCKTKSLGSTVKKRATIGIVMPTEHQVIDTPFFFGCQLGICDVAALRRQTVVLIPDCGGNAKDFASFVTKAAPSGIIFTRSVNDSDILDVVTSKNIPFIIIGNSSDKNAVLVDSDVVSSCDTLTAALLKDNEKIAFIGGNQKNRVQRRRYEGFLQAHLSSEKYADKSLVFLNCENSDEISQAMEAALSASVRCVIASDDVICEKIIRWTRDRHLAIPRDLRLASFYNSRALTNNDPPITAINVDPKAVGTVAAELLFDMLEGRNVDKLNLVSHNILLRKSTF